MYHTKVEEKRVRHHLIGKKIALTIFSSLLISFLLFGITVRGVQASEPKTHRYKYYTSIQIQEGDTLWGIADYIANTYQLDTDQCLRELKSMNNLKNDTIRVGNYLTVFYYDEEYRE